MSEPIPDAFSVVRLARRPEVEVRPEDFELAEVPMLEPGPGQVLVRTLWMSVDPLMRLRMGERTGAAHVPPFELGQPLDGSAVARVVASRSDRFAVGDLVLTHSAWQEFAVYDEGADGWFDPIRVELPEGASEQAFLGVLGVSGLTAYVGLREIGRLQPGETVYVSAVGGAVGGVAAQLAVHWGHPVVASAGSADKVERALERYGVSAAFNYRDGDLDELLTAAAPDGVDLYYDNVGGAHLDAALAALRPNGRVVLCGQVGSVAAGAPQGPTRLMEAILKSVRLEGFMVRHHAGLWPQYIREASQLVSDGSLWLPETSYDGLAQAPMAMIDMLGGRTDGKVSVQL